MTTGLSKSLGVFRGTALLLNIVVGAGLLTLPGLAIKQLGGIAFAAWTICALSAVPLLAVFIVLGRRYPDAGGITSYAFRAFGPIGRNITSALFLGAVTLGLPAIALTGGHYLAAATGSNPHLYAAALVAIGASLHFLPGDGVAKAMGWVASAILGCLVIFLIIGVFGTAGVPSAARIEFPAIQQVSGIGSSFMMLFFAFTGWEVGAGIGEEFENPKYQFPIAMVISFCLATALYLCSAFVAQRTDLTGMYEAPFVAIILPVLGARAAQTVAVVAAVIVLANLAGAIWGVSRIIYSLSKDGKYAALFAATVRGRPLVAVSVTTAALLLVLALDAGGWLGLERMLAIAGQNFLIIYALAAGALVVLAKASWERGLGLFVLALTALLLFENGEVLRYPIALACCAGAFTILFGSSSQVKPAERGLQS